MHKIPTKFEQLSQLVLLGFLLVCCCIFLIPSRAQAASIDDDEDTIELGTHQVIRYKIDNNFKVRGWQLAPEVYLGNAKVNGKWGFGLLVDKGNYVYGLNNTQASIMWRF